MPLVLRRGERRTTRAAFDQPSTQLMREPCEGNEVGATLGLLSLQGCIVTADALHCHRRMAAAVRAAADYALVVKASRPALLRDARAALDAACAGAPAAETRDV